MKKALGYSILAILLIAVIIYMIIGIEAKWWEVLALFGGVALIVTLMIFAVNLIINDEN